MSGAGGGGFFLGGMGWSAEEHWFDASPHAQRRQVHPVMVMIVRLANNGWGNPNILKNDSVHTCHHDPLAAVCVPVSLLGSVVRYRSRVGPRAAAHVCW